MNEWRLETNTPVVVTTTTGSQEAAQQIAAALEQAGVPQELRVYDDEGHGLAKRTNKLDAYRAAIDFLHIHLTAHRDAAFPTGHI